MKQDKDKSEKKNMKKIILLLLVLLTLLTVISILIFQTIYRPPAVVTTDEVEDGKYVKEMNGDALKKYLQDKADKNYVHIQVSPTMVFKDSESVGTLAIKNSPKNNYSIRVMSYLEDQPKDKIYDSGLIAPGQYVSEGKLLKKVGKGIHETINKVMYYDLNKKVVGQSNVIGTLSVDN